MTQQEIERAFRDNLLRIIDERGLTAAGVSKGAGVNARFIADMKVGQKKSPKLSTAYMIAEFLGLDIKDIIEGRSRSQVNQALFDMLSEHPEDQQEQILLAVRALSRTAANQTLVDRLSKYSEAEQEQILAAVEALTGLQEKER